MKDSHSVLKILALLWFYNGFTIGDKIGFFLMLKSKMTFSSTNTRNFTVESFFYYVKFYCLCISSSHY